MRRTKTWVYGPMGWIWCIRCKKFWCDFVTRTFKLIAPVQPVLQLASCSNETIRNAPKHYETHQNMSFGSNGMDRVHSFWKILMQLRGTNLCINCTISAHFLHRVSCSNKMVPNAPKHYETHQNMSLGSDGVDRVDLLQKILTQFCGLNFCINFNSSAHF